MIRMRSGHSHRALKCSSRPLGVYLARPSAFSTSCTFVLTAYAVPVTAVHAVYPSRRHLSAKVRAFVDALADAFARSTPHGDGRESRSQSASWAGSGTLPGECYSAQIAPAKPFAAYLKACCHERN